MIDKLSGDEIMAVFEGPEMAQNALQCGKTICEAFGDSKNFISEIFSSPFLSTLRLLISDKNPCFQNKRSSLQQKIYNIRGKKPT